MSSLSSPLVVKRPSIGIQDQGKVGLRYVFYLYLNVICLCCFCLAVRVEILRKEHHKFSCHNGLALPPDRWLSGFLKPFGPKYNNRKAFTIFQSIRFALVSRPQQHVNLRPTSQSGKGIFPIVEGFNGIDLFCILGSKILRGDIPKNKLLQTHGRLHHHHQIPCSHQPFQVLKSCSLLRPPMEINFLQIGSKKIL